MKGWLKGVLKHDKHEDAEDHPTAASAAAAAQLAAPASTQPAAAGVAQPPAAATNASSPSKDTLQPVSPLASPFAPATSPLFLASPSTHTSPTLSPAAHSASPHAPVDANSLPTLLAQCQKLIQTFLSKHRSHPPGQPSALPADLLLSLKQLTSLATFDATRLGVDGPKLVAKLSELCAKCVKDIGGHGGPDVVRSTAVLHEAMSAPHPDMHDMDGFSAVKALFYLFTGPSTTKALPSASSSSSRIVPPSFSSGHNSAIKAHLPTTLIDIILANANVQVTVSGQTLTTVGGAAMKKQPSIASAIQAAVGAPPHPPTATKAAASLNAPKASSTLSDCEYHSFTLLAILCSHDHTAIEDLISHHKLDTLLLLSSVQGPSAYALSPVTSVFHSNLLKLLKCVSKGQKLVKAVSKALHDTAVVQQLLEALQRGSETDVTSADGTVQTSSASSQLSYDCFDLVTTFLLDSFPHSPVILDDFEAHDGYATILAFLVRYCRRIDRVHQSKTVSRRLAAIMTVGYAKLDIEHDVLPFNLPPSSRTSAAHSLLPPVPTESPSAKVLLSSTLSINPSLPETHSHAIGQLPTTPSIARLRGHARISSNSFASDNISISALSAASSPTAATASSHSSANRPAASTGVVRNLEAVQLVRDVLLQCPSSTLRLNLLQSIEFIFISAAQLHNVSSTGLTSRLLQSLPSFSTPVQHALLHSLQLIISHCHNDYIPFKELCALNVTLTAELSPSSLPSIQSVLISLDAMLEYDQLRYQHLLREAGVLDVMVTNVTQWYALFAVAFEERWDPQSSSHAFERETTGAFRRASAFSPRAEALSTIQLEVRKRRGMGTPSASPTSDIRRRLDGDDRRENDSPQPSPSAASRYGSHSRNTSLTFPLPTIHDTNTPHHPTSATSSASSLSVTHLVRVVSSCLDVLTVLLRDSSTNQELFSTTSGPAVLLSFTVYPPTATKALHLLEQLLQAHYTRLEAMLAPPAGARRDRKPEPEAEAERVNLNRSASIEGIMTGGTAGAPKTVQALQLLGDAYMLALLHLLFSSLPAIAFELPFYRTPPSDPALLLKPANLSLATHPKLRTFFPLPTSTSAIDTNSILRIGRLLHLIRRALSSSYYGQQSFGRMRGFERVASLMKGLSVRQIQITRGELGMAPMSRQQSGSGGDASEGSGTGSGAVMVSNVAPSTSPSPPSTSHSAVLFLLQEVMLTFILAMKGNERNSAYPYPRPLPSHYHLSDMRNTIGFHMVGYRRLTRYLLKSGVVCGDDGNSWTVCADLVCNWMFWMALEYLPSDHELISTPSLPCTLNTQQLEQQLNAEMKEEQDMIKIALNEQTGASPPTTSPPFTPPTAAALPNVSAVPTLRVNTEDQSASTWPCWWEQQEATIEFTPVPVHKLVLQQPGTVHHPLALRLVARFLSYSSHHLQRRFLVLLTLLVKGNAVNALAVGQADVLAPLVSFFRPVLNQPLDVRHQLMLDVLHLLMPFSPGASSMHALFSLFDQPSRFPTSLLTWLTDVATRSVPMPYVLLDGKDAGMRVGSINSAKWPPSNGYTVAAWVFIETTVSVSLSRNNSSGEIAGRKSPALSANLPLTHHRHHLSVQVEKATDADSPNISPVRAPVRKMSAQLPSHPLPPSAPSKTVVTNAVPPSPSLPPASPSPASTQPSASSSPFSLLRIESDDGKSVFSLIFHPLSGQLTLRTAGRTSYAFPGVRLQLGRWNHIVLTHSSSFIQGSWCHLFINGVHQLETKVSYINKGGSTANVSAFMGGSVSGLSSQSIDLSNTNSTTSVEGAKHVSRPSAGSLQVPGGERLRSNSVSAPTATTKEAESPPGTPNPSTASSSPASTSSTAATAFSSSAVSRWRLASCLLTDDVLPDVLVKSLYELGPRTSAIVHAASRPTVVDTLASVHSKTRSLNVALDNIQLLVPKISRRAQWSVVSPAEEAAALALSKRAVGSLLELDQLSRTRLAASPTESAGKSITAVVAYERILFFFHAANGQDVAAAVHTTSINPKQMDFRIDNSGPPAITSDARLIAPATVVQPRAVVDRLKQIGGMRRLLALVEKCAAGKDEGGPDAPGMALRQVLLLISQAVRRHPSNHRDMNEIDGYKLLGHLLKQISVRAKQSAQAVPHPQQSMRRASITSPFPTRTPSPIPPANVGAHYTPSSLDAARDVSSTVNSPLLHPSNMSQPPTAIAVVTSLLDVVAVEILFSLVGLSDSGAAGVISNSAALEYLILDFHIWCECPVEVQLYLFQCLFNCICTSSARDENITALRESRVVGWLISLASDVGLHTDVLNCCVSIVRELMLHQIIDHELHIIADFAATSIMTDSRPEPQQQQSMPSRRSPFMRRRDSLEVAGVTVLSSSEDTYSQQLPFTPSSQYRRFGDDYASVHPSGSPSAAAASAADASFKVQIGSKAAARVNGLFIEMLLDVLLKVRSNPKQLAAFIKRIDFSWLYCVLHSGDPQATNQTPQQQQRYTRRGSIARASGPLPKPGPNTGGEVQSAAILALKILMVLLQDSHLFSKFKSSPGFASLPPLLLPHCYHGQVFSILLCTMLGKSVLDVPTTALDINAIGSVEAWTSLLNGAASAEGEGGVVVAELVPVVIALLRECIELTKHHQANAAVATATSPSPAQPAASVAAADISRPMSPVRPAIVLESLESFSTRTSSSSTESAQHDELESEGVIVDLSADMSLELNEAPRPTRSESARHQRTMTVLENGAQPRPLALNVEAASPAVSLSLPTPNQRSPSRRATFNPHESGNVAATVQAKRKKTHGRSGSLHMYELFSPSNELLKAAEGADDETSELKEPKTPLSARIADFLTTKGDDAEGERELSTDDTVSAIGVVNGVQSSPSRRAARHRTMLTISTTVPARGSAENTPASRGRQLTREAKESTAASADAEEPESAQLVILHPEDGASESNTSAIGEQPASSRPLTPLGAASRPITPITPGSPEAVHTTTGLKALRTIKNRDTFHTIAHYGQQRGAHHHHSHSSVSSAYAHHYHAHIVNQPDIKAMNGTITFMTRLFNISDTFRTLACKQAFMRQLISAVFASATMGSVLPQLPQQPYRKAADESRAAESSVPIAHHMSQPNLPSLAALEAEQDAKDHMSTASSPFVNDDPTVPTAPHIDLRIYSVDASEPSSPSSMIRQTSDFDASPSPSSSGRHLGGRNLSLDRPVDIMPRIRKSSSVIITSASQYPVTEQPIRGTLANIDTADLFRHSTSVLLFQLLRQIVVQNLLTRTKGTHMLMDCLDQAPASSNLQQRIRYQTTLLAGLSSRLEERLSGVVILGNSKLAYTVDRLGQLFVERLEQGMFLNGGPSTFQFVLHILLMPECRQVVDDMLQADKDKAAARASVAGMRVIRPLFDILNQVVLYMCEGYNNGEVTAADIVQLNETLLQQAKLLLNEHNSSRTLIACLCHHLHKQMAGKEDEVSASAIRLWSWLMKNKLETMMELLRATITEQKTAALTRTTSQTAESGGPLSPPPVSDASVSTGGALSGPTSPSSVSGRFGGFVPPPISRKRLVDLLDDDGKGGFDQLMQAATGVYDGTGEPHWMTDFRLWLHLNEKRIAAVFAITLQSHWSAFLAAQKREQSNSWNKQQAHVLQDMGRHRQEEQDRLKKAAQMELTILNKLQTTSNVEIQRLLRRDQRLTEIDKQADKAWCKVKAAMVVAQLMYDNVEHKLPPTQERLKRMRDDMAGKRSWQLMMERNDAVDEDEWRMTGDDNALSIDEWEANSGNDRVSSLSSPGSDSSLVFRQPWRVESSEGPARVRRRLCALVAMKPDAPLFSHPYKLWEEERRSSITGEREKAVDGAEGDGEGDAADVDEHEETFEMDVAVELHDNEPQEVGFGDEQGRVNMPAEFEQAGSGDGTGEELKTAETSGEVINQLHPEAVHVRRTSVTINADGLIIGTDSSSRTHSPSLSPRQIPRSPLRIDTRHGGSAIFSQTAPTDGVSAPRSPANQLSVEATISPALQRVRSSSFSSSPRSGSRSIQRGLSLTTNADSIPAVAAEPRRRKRHGLAEGELESPHTPNSASRQSLITAAAVDHEIPSADVKTGEPLPFSNALMPMMSAPVYSVPAALNSSNLDISIVAPSESEADTKPPTPPRQSVSEFMSPENSARRVLGRPRSMTAEDAAPQSLAPPAGPPMLQTSHSADTLRAAETASNNSPQPLTPSVPLPGSQEDDEAAEADDLLFLEEDKLKLLMEGDEIHYHWNCVRVYGMEEIRGILCLCERSIFVVDEYEISPDGDIVKLVCDPSDQHSAMHAAMADEDKFFRWQYGEVIEVAKRRYLLRPAALELFFNDGSNQMLVVNVEQREAVFNHLIDYCPLIRSTRLFKTLLASPDANLASMQQSIAPLTKQWQQGELSNFDYLMALNSVAGRTYNDLTQYPVFPWVVRDYDSTTLRIYDPATYRDLSKPMGALTEPRAAVFKQRYRDSQQMDEETPPAFYGTHYSTAAVVLYYMLRCEPFTQHVIAFQSGRFDRPDRLFHSIKQSWLSASQLNVMDVKELIPEFYTSSDFLLNGNQLKLGQRQDEQRVNDVLLPRWAHGSTRQFVRLHRQALESEYVSANLHHWVDLIFGFQQTGREAVSAQNVFFYLTYAGQVDIDKIQDPVRRSATIEQIRSFGQTPTQLFTQPHPPRKMMPKPGALLRSSLLQRFTAARSEMVSHPVAGLHVSEPDGRVYVTRPGFVIVPGSAAPSGSHHGLNRLTSMRKLRQQAVSKAKSIVAFVSCGFADRSVRTGLVTTNSTPSGFPKPDAVQYSRVYLNMHDMGGVGVVAMPEVDVGLMVTAGTEDCCVMLWKADPTPAGLYGDYQFAGAMYGHTQPVTCLAVSRAFSLIASGSSDSTVIVWDLNKREAVRQLRVVPFGAVITAVNIDHLTGYIAIASRSPDILTLVDVNGVMLAQYPDIRRLDSSIATRSAAASVANGDVPADGRSVSPLQPASDGQTSPGSAPTRPRPSSVSLGLSLDDPISCLHVVDAAGYQCINSLLCIITGHSSGHIRVWYVTFDLVVTPSPPSTASSTLQLSDSNSSIASMGSDTASDKERAQMSKSREEETKTSDASADGTMLRRRSLPLVETINVPITPERGGSVPSVPAALSSSASTVSLVAIAASAAPAPAAVQDFKPAHHYSGDLPLPEVFDAAQLPAASPTSHSSAPYSPVSSITSPPASSPATSASPVPLPARAWHLRPVAEWHRHTCPVLSIHVTADCSGFYSGDSHGLVLQWSLSLSDEQRTNISGVSGVGSPPADAVCQCKVAASASKGGFTTRSALKRYCLCHPRTCRQVVCDHCVLDHIRASHSPAQHRAAAMHGRQKTSRDLGIAKIVSDAADSRTETTSGAAASTAESANTTSSTLSTSAAAAPANGTV